MKIDTKKYTVDIYLETIGKTEILKEKIKMGKKVEYNEKENIIKIIDQWKIEKKKHSNLPIF